MESKREQVWVGLFVIVAATLLIVTVFVLTGAFAGYREDPSYAIPQRSGAGAWSHCSL